MRIGAYPLYSPSIFALGEGVVIRMDGQMAGRQNLDLPPVLDELEPLHLIQ